MAKLPAPLEVVAPALQTEDDRETAESIIKELPLTQPMPGADFADRYVAGLTVLRKRAPATAELLSGLYNHHSDHLGGPIMTLSAAYDHLQRERAGEGKNKTGRPLTTGIEQADAQAERIVALERKKEAQRASAARYQAKLECYADRRAKLASAKAALTSAQEQRRAAQRQFNEQWDAYIAQHKQHLLALESIPADDWMVETGVVTP